MEASLIPVPLCTSAEPRAYRIACQWSDQVADNPSVAPLLQLLHPLIDIFKC
jgi:hypothetical protein